MKSKAVATKLAPRPSDTIAVVAATPQPELPFRRLGRYEVLAPIAEGGMATVWLGRSLDDPRALVALKVIRPEHARNKDFIAMFADEARIASRLAHPNIVRLFGLGHDGKRHFLAMEVLRGSTLLASWEAARARGIRMAYEVAAWIGARIADALEHAHELRGEDFTLLHVVHRDVNPANIFLCRDGAPKLIDFGVARARDRIASTAAGVVKGKLAYLSPEQTHGKPADRRADVFALSVTLWELTLDRRLFREDSDVATIRRIRETHVPDPATLADGYPRALADAIVRGLARDPDDRWQTAGQLRDALDAFVAQSSRRTDEGSVRAIVAQLNEDRAPAPWEQLAETEGGEVERIRVWDDDRQKLTWMEASIEPVAAESANQTTAKAGRDDASDAATPSPTRRETLRRELAAQGERADSVDRLGAVRLPLQRALVEEILGDPSLAERHAREALDAAPSGWAHAALRRLGDEPGRERQLVAHLDAEIELLSSEAPRAHLLAERARLLEAAGEPREAVRAAWERALAVDGRCPAALTGLEAALASDPSAREALAIHLARMADAYTAEPALAAQLLVERARVLERELGQPDAAKAALQRALSTDPGATGVRAECLAHSSVHRDAAWFVALLEEEAARADDPERAARCEVDAGCVAHRRLADTGLAVALLERAVARSAGPPVRRRALDELVILHEAAGRSREALRVRRLRLAALEDPRTRAHELRAIASIQESLGDAATAIAALEQSLALAPDDTPLAEALDRLLERELMTRERSQLWARLAANVADGPRRARRLVLAAQLAEASGEREAALSQLRAALVSDPICGEATDALLRLLAASPSQPAQTAIDDVRVRIAVHAHAAEHAADPARRVAHLEAIAWLQEERLDDPTEAAATYETILQVERRRRSALVGLARTSARAGDSGRLARALLEEADGSTDPNADSLRVRAAEVLRATDAERALGIVREVLARAPEHEEARLVEQRLHEAAGRWAQVDAALAARIEHTSDAAMRADLWLARADLQCTRLRSPVETLASLRAALAVDAAHPAAREALFAQLRAAGDDRELRDALVELAPAEPTAAARARALGLAAEIDELVLLDDAAAAELYARALRETPDDVWLEERRARVVRRAAHSNRRGLRESDTAGEVARAEEELARQPSSAAALRTLERAARDAGSGQRLAEILGRQAVAFASDAPKLGALWAQVALVRRKLVASDEAALVDAILLLAPDDRAALDAALRQSLPGARAGDGAARARATAAIRALLQQTTGDETDRLCANLAAALLLEREDVAPDEEHRAALACYREALRIDPRSVVAASGAARLAAALDDGEAMIAATIALGELAPEPRRRAALLVGAAGRIISALDPRLGARMERLVRAGELLERALEADPDILSAVGLLVAVRSEDGQRDRLLVALRKAFDGAKSSGAIARLGGEIARVAGVDAAGRMVAIEALRRVLEVQPRHAPTLRAIADLYVAQAAWGEAVEALHALAAHAREAQARLGAQFELANLYSSVLGRPADAERALRAALEIDPASVEALRRLLGCIRAAENGSGELPTLLARLGDAETDPEAKAAALTELAQLRRAAGNVAGAEQALMDALAHAPTPARLSMVADLHGEPPAQARLLAGAVARAEGLQRPHAACLEVLGLLEVEALGRWADGVAHLRSAIALAPALHEARAALANGLLNLGVAGEALSLLLSMVVREPGALLALRDPARALTTLEGALAAEARHEEAIVARELRALCGGLDDGTLAALRARRVALDPRASPAAPLGAQLLRTSVVPREADSLLLEVAAAFAGVEAKVALLGSVADAGPRRANDPPASARITARARIAPTSGHPALALLQRLSAMFGIPRPEIAIAERGAFPTLAIVQDAPWIAIPSALLEQPEPDLTAALVPLLVRLTLAVPWVNDLRGADAHALLCGAARLVVPGYGADQADAAQSARVDEMARRVGKILGRRQKKALAELAPALGATRAPTLLDVAAWEDALRRTELRAAFLATGDLLATIGAARAHDERLALATLQFAPAALRAVLEHPVAGDVVRFALAPATTALRSRTGALWTQPQ
jgi:tetratricopeptide (TPR) repeat protein